MTDSLLNDLLGMGFDKHYAELAASETNNRKPSQPYLQFIH